MGGKEAFQTNGIELKQHTESCDQALWEHRIQREKLRSQDEAEKEPSKP